MQNGLCKKAPRFRDEYPRLTQECDARIIEKYISESVVEIKKFLKYISQSLRIDIL